MYDWFDNEGWEKCFSLVDPRLRESKVQLRRIGRHASLQTCLRNCTSLDDQDKPHLDESLARQDKRQFAYVYVVWPDDEHRFHMFQERWSRNPAAGSRALPVSCPPRRIVPAMQFPTPK